MHCRYNYLPQPATSLRMQSPAGIFQEYLRHFWNISDRLFQIIPFLEAHSNIHSTQFLFLKSALHESDISVSDRQLPCLKFPPNGTNKN